jgi:hypothetical protein
VLERLAPAWSDLNSLSRESQVSEQHLASPRSMRATIGGKMIARINSKMTSRMPRAIVGRARGGFGSLRSWNTRLEMLVVRANTRAQSNYWFE